MHDITIKFKVDGEFRRIKIQVDESNSPLSTLVSHITGLGIGQCTKVFYRDDDNDLILVGTDKELIDLIGETGGKLLLEVNLKDPEQKQAVNTGLLVPKTEGGDSGSSAPPRPSSIAAVNNDKVEHKEVLCDICDTTIIGHRFKCIICNDYDLCEDCERTGVHSEHAMLRIVHPQNTLVPWGARLQRVVPLRAVNGSASRRASSTSHRERIHERSEQLRELTKNGLNYLTEMGKTVTSVLADMGIDATYEVRPPQEPSVPVPTDHSLNAGNGQKKEPSAPVGGQESVNHTSVSRPSLLESSCEAAKAFYDLSSKSLAAFGVGEPEEKMKEVVVDFKPTLKSNTEKKRKMDNQKSDSKQKKKGDEGSTKRVPEQNFPYQRDPSRVIRTLEELDRASREALGFGRHKKQTTEEVSAAVPRESEETRSAFGNIASDRARGRYAFEKPQYNDRPFDTFCSDGKKETDDRQSRFKNDGFSRYRDSNDGLFDERRRDQGRSRWTAEDLGFGRQTDRHEYTFGSGAERNSKSHGNSFGRYGSTSSYSGRVGNEWGWGYHDRNAFGRHGGSCFGEWSSGEEEPLDKGWINYWNRSKKESRRGKDSITKEKNLKSEKTQKRSHKHNECKVPPEENSQGTETPSAPIPEPRVNHSKADFIADETGCIRSARFYGPDYFRWKKQADNSIKKEEPAPIPEPEVPITIDANEEPAASEGSDIAAIDSSSDSDSWIDAALEAPVVQNTGAAAVVIPAAEDLAPVLVAVQPVVPVPENGVDEQPEAPPALGPAFLPATTELEWTMPNSVYPTLQSSSEPDAVESGSITPNNAVVKALIDMGFTLVQAKRAVAHCGNNVESCINFMIGN